ncbi:hypothetical protein [Rhizobium croatiense]|uniref:hypothetical protein n=1 Tax=Rhizobium croatiense TaxID=2867516 RepID=UPI0023ED6FD8|nr:hypothetical protein [Rhizobium croatiense]WET75402.1 hypothetical protein PYR68_07890 [Rhizobium croatiense]
MIFEAKRRSIDLAAVGGIGEGLIVEPIRNEDDIHQRAHDYSVISVYLDRAISRQLVEYILATRDGFDAFVADAWHLLVPYRGQGTNTGPTGEYAFNENVSAADFDAALAGELIRRFEIDEEDLPCIVFLSTEDGVENISVSVKDMDAEDIADVLEEIGRIILRRKSLTTNAREFRTGVAADIKRYLLIGTAKRYSARVVKALMAIGAIAGIKGLF